MPNSADGGIMKKKLVLAILITLLAISVAAFAAGCNKSYTVTFELPMDSKTGLTGRNIYTTVTQAKDTELVFPDNPTTATWGMEFDGWFDEDGNRIEELTLTQDVTLYGKWKKVEYNITYDLQGGGGLRPNEVNPSTYTMIDGVQSFYSPVSSRKGYQFAGWYDDNGKEWTNIPSSTTGDIALKAVWQPVPYRVIYKLSGGENSKENPLTYDITQEVEFSEATRKGYVFLGWFDSEEGGSEVKRIPVGTTGNFTVYAQWEIIEYSITYDLADGYYDEGISNPSSYTVESGAIINIPLKRGYTFKGWYDEISKTTYDRNINIGTIGDKKLVAQWELTNYYLDFDLDGGRYNDGESNPEYYTMNDEIIFVNPVKDGFTFGGWKDVESDDIVTQISAGETGNRNFIAVWN